MKSKSNSKYSMNSTTTKTWLPVHLCPGNLFSPATQLCIPYDCTSPVIKPVPTVFPASHVPWHYPHSTPLPPTAASAKRQHVQSLFLVKKVLTGQPVSAWWLPGDRLNRTDHCWAHHAAFPSLGALLGVSSLFIRVIFTKSVGIWPMKFLLFCLTSSNLQQFQVIFKTNFKNY